MLFWCMTTSQLGSCSRETGISTFDIDVDDTFAIDTEDIDIDNDFADTSPIVPDCVDLRVELQEPCRKLH